jgi:hypothetical protein
MSRFQVLLADAAGDAAIVEGAAVIRKEGPFLVVTNFRRSEDSFDRTLCPRYRIARDMLNGRPSIDRAHVRRILAATHSEGGFATLYSNIYDLRARRVYLYHFHNFEDEVVIDLAADLKRCSGARDIYTLFGPNHAAAQFRAQYTELTKAYTHDALPRFTVRYPEVCDIKKVLHSDQVFMAMGRHGKVPALSVSVAPVPAGMALPEVGSFFVAPRLGRLGTRVSIVSNQPARLVDGMAAYESRFTWRWDNDYRVNSLVLSAIRDEKLVTVALHHTGALDHLKHIPYSLSFSPEP